MVAFTVSIQEAIPRASLKSATENGFRAPDEPVTEALAALLILGEMPGSERGGEPKAAVFTLTKEPQ